MNIEADVKPFSHSLLSLLESCKVDHGHPIIEKHENLP